MIQQHPTTPQNNTTRILDYPIFLNIFKLHPTFLDHPTRWPNNPALAIQHMLDENLTICWIVWPGIQSGKFRNYIWVNLGALHPCSKMGVATKGMALSACNPSGSSRLIVSIGQGKVREQSGNFRFHCLWPPHQAS